MKSKKGILFAEALTIASVISHFVITVKIYKDSPFIDDKEGLTRFPWQGF